MIAEVLRRSVAKTGPPIPYIAPGPPWENGDCESFTGKLRGEGLREEIFHSPREARIVIGLWQNIYNRVRPHSSLGYRPPAPVTRPDLAFQLPVAAAIQEPLTRLGPEYRSGPSRLRQAVRRPAQDGGNRREIAAQIVQKLGPDRSSDHRDRRATAIMRDF